MWNTNLTSGTLGFSPRPRRNGRSMPMPSKPQTGFTLVELIIVILITSVLAAAAAPRFFERSAFEERGYYEDTLAALRFAQKLAVATGCQVQASITANSFTLNQRATSCTSGAYTKNVFNPGDPGNAYTKTAPSDLTLSPATTLTFNGLGQVSGGAYTITLTGAADTRSITLVPETGLVY
jgi:MSHA pilin protein MshC